MYTKPLEQLVLLGLIPGVIVTDITPCGKLPPLHTFATVLVMCNIYLMLCTTVFVG